MCSKFCLIAYRICNYCNVCLKEQTKCVNRCTIQTKDWYKSAVSLENNIIIKATSEMIDNMKEIHLGMEQTVSMGFYDQTVSLCTSVWIPFSNILSWSTYKLQHVGKHQVQLGLWWAAWWGGGVFNRQFLLGLLPMLKKSLHLYFGIESEAFIH